MTKILRAAVGTALVALAIIVLAACGSTSGGSGTDTATLAPASSFLYAEATIDPSGGQQSAMRSILGDLPGSGAPEQRLNNLLEQASKADKTGKVDYAQDIQPWLGDKAALFVAPPAASRPVPPFAVLLATTDESKAQDAIDKAREAGDRKKSYRGTDYLLDNSGNAAVATLNGFVVLGSEAGLRSAVDVAKNSAGSLSQSDRFKQASKNANSDRVGLVYEDIGGLIQTAMQASGQSLGPVAPLVGRMFGGNPAVATIRAENQALVIDGSLFPSSSVLKASSRTTPLLGDVPANSWLALGQADFGGVVKQLIGLVAGAVGGQQVLEQQLRGATGLDLNKDLLSWIGDVAIFVNGDSKQTIGGGLLIQSKDPAASRAALTKLAALIARSSGGSRVSAAHFGSASGYRMQARGAPRGIYMLQSGDRVALTYGESAARSALNGSGGGLTNTPGFSGAAGKLGGAYSPSLYLSVPPILRLADSFGATGPGWAKAKPYVSILDYLVAGSATSGNAALSRMRIGFKPHD
jgi:hypothetical protein